MALQSFTITVGAQVDVNGKNYIAGQVVYIKKLNGTLASIYSDLGGLSPIPQDGFSNVTNSDGQFTFYIETGEYNAESGGKVTPITVVGSDYFTSKINEVVLELSKSRGFRVVGDFASGFTYELPNDVGVDGSGNYWIYSDVSALPVTVSTGTAPSSPTYTQVTFNDAQAVSYSENGNVDAALRKRASYYTLSEAQASDLNLNQYVHMADYANALYKVVSDADTGGLYLSYKTGYKFRLQHDTHEIKAEWYGLTPSVPDITSLFNTLTSYARGKVGRLTIGAGTYTHTGTLLASYSNFAVVGAGSDRTIFKPTGDIKTAMEVNNGSWNELTKTYTTSGTSIGSNQLKGFTLNGTATTGADNDALVLARATLGCNYEDIKITHFKGADAVGLRTYGTWYAKFYGVILENNTHNHSMGYEANDMLFSGCDWVSNPVAQSKTHLTIGGGTCRTVTFEGCGFDGVPKEYGIRARGVHNLNIYGGYLEVYNSETVKTANFIELGNDCVGFNIDGTNLITGTGYSGTWLKCAIASGDAGRHIKFGANFQYNGDSNNCIVIDTTNSASVEISPMARLEKAIIIGNVSEVSRRDVSNTYIPATTGADEVIVPIFTISSSLTIPVLRIRVTAVRAGTVIAGQRLRVLINGTTTIDYQFTSANIAAGESFDLTDISSDGYITTTGKPSVNNQYAKDSKIELWTYKVGSAQDWPDFNVEVVGM